MLSEQDLRAMDSQENWRMGMRIGCSAGPLRPNVPSSIRVPRRIRQFFQANNVHQCDVFQSISQSIVIANGENRARAKDNDLVRTTNVVGLATRDMDSERSEKLASYKFEKIVRSHGTRSSIRSTCKHRMQPSVAVAKGGFH
jgi:hypothetical protein